MFIRIGIPSPTYDRTLLSQALLFLNVFQRHPFPQNDRLGEHLYLLHKVPVWVFWNYQLGAKRKIIPSGVRTSNWALMLTQLVTTAISDDNSFSRYGVLRTMYIRTHVHTYTYGPYCTCRTYCTCCVCCSYQSHLPYLSTYIRTRVHTYDTAYVHTVDLLCLYKYSSNG